MYENEMSRWNFISIYFSNFVYFQNENLVFGSYNFVSLIKGENLQKVCR